MKEKMHITVLTLGACALMGITFAVSSKDYQEKAPKLNSAPETSIHSQKFVCTKTSISDSSQTTRDYNENIKKREKLLIKIDSLGGDTVTLRDPCEGMKGEDKSQCIKKNTQLQSTLQQVKQLEKKLKPYKDCQKSLGIKTTKSSIKWSEGEWATCSDGKQKRIVECQSDGKKVADNKCEGKKPITSKVCKNVDSTTSKSKDESIAQKGITQVQGKYTALGAAEKLAKLGIISNNTKNPELYNLDELLTRKEVAEILLRTMGLFPTTPIQEYICKNIFTDTPDQKTCLIAETVLKNKIIDYYRHEDGEVDFKGDNHVSVGEIFIFSKRSQCMNRYPWGGDRLGTQELEIGFKDSESLNAISTGTKGDLYITLLTYKDYFDNNTKTSPEIFDANLVGCSKRITNR